MKSISTFLVAVLLSASVFAQSIEKMSYQAVIRDAGNNLVTSQAVGMQLSILQGSTSGTAVYVETQVPTTNANGLVSIEIGGGTVVSGDFATIDWANGPYFLKIETDPTGGSIYTITGTSQLLSVPYALHAKTAETVSGPITETDPVYGASVANGITVTDTANWNNKLDSYTETDPVFGAWDKDYNDLTNKPITDGSETKLSAGTDVTITGSGTQAKPYVINASGSESSIHHVGQLYGGGIVFWVYQKGEHGLIASLVDLDSGSGAGWGLYGTYTANCESMTDGEANTAAIIAAGPAAGTAAVLCNDFTGGGYTDWYLPSIRELYLLATQDILIDKILDNDGDANTSGLTQEYRSSNYGRYWSSTETNGSNAWHYDFNEGYSNLAEKYDPYKVRAVRAF